MRVLLSYGILAMAFVTQIACVRPPPRPFIYRLGDKVRTGALIYNVLGTEWLRKIGEGPLARIPVHRFLVVHLSATNSGAAAASVPSLSLSGPGDQVFGESMEGQDIPASWGMVRTVQPGSTLEGRVLFDVEPKTYNLKLEDTAGAMSLVELPLHFEEGESNAPPPVLDPR
jgi:hypothetical protein